MLKTSGTRKMLDRMVATGLHLHQDRATGIWIIRDRITGQELAHEPTRDAAMTALPQIIDRVAATRIPEPTYQGLRSRRIPAIEIGRAKLEVTGEGDERRFTMTGPSGRHTLLLAATDHARLQAHWQNFAADSRNA